MDKIKKASLIMVEIRYLWTIADKNIKSVLFLNKNFSPDYVYSIELLSVQAVELLLKVSLASNMCCLNKDKTPEYIKDTINKTFKNHGHDIKKLFDSNKSLITKLGISHVESFNNSFVNEYRIFFKYGKIICLKELESIRYGSFATKQNVANGFFEEYLFSFLHILSENIHNIITETEIILRKS